MRGYSTKLHSSFEAIYLQRGSKEQSVVVGKRIEIPNININGSLLKENGTNVL
jgi:hypothetical protein